MAQKFSRAARPAWPHRAVVTAGMPYGNKGLHFGHVGGVFVPADFYARFLRDRLGRENVIFVSGTDCYGSPIMEGHRKRVENDGYEGGLADYVQENHIRQETTLDNYGISCDLFAGSALEPSARIHERVTAEVLNRLYEQGKLSRLSTKQFFDPKAGVFLNGRQVLGRCPIQGCKSEKAYADECDLGHQFEPEELIAPKSALTGETPELVPVDNLYFDLPAYLDFMRAYTKKLESDPTVRSVVSKTMEEWLLPAQLYIQIKFRDAFDAIEAELPEHTVTEPEGNKSSFTVTFPSWKERDEAHEILNRGGVRFRSGKALVPFRITGNVEWGVPVPDIDGCSGLTAWVWPESLWAPISITRSVLAGDAQKLDAEGRTDETAGTPAESDAQISHAAERVIPAPAYTHSSLDWHDWWASEDSRVYQFIGQDNIYFYCVAQPAMWKALDWGLTQDVPVANYHILFMNKKASSSGAIKPPMAAELLDSYTPEQLRAHWLSLGLDQRAVSFNPKAFDTSVSHKDKATGEDVLVRDDPRVVDPALKESAFLTNIFNRIARSCLYGAANVCDGHLPCAAPAPEAVEAARRATLDFEERAHAFDAHGALAVAEDYCRAANKRWDEASKAAKGDDDAYEAALADAFVALRTTALLMHPAVPRGCELVCEHMGFSPEEFFTWDHAFDGPVELAARRGEAPQEHAVVALPPRFDFFERHPSQSRR